LITSPMSERSSQSIHRGVDLISDALLFGRLWYDGPEAASQRNRLREIFQPVARRDD